MRPQMSSRPIAAAGSAPASTSMTPSNNPPPNGLFSFPMAPPFNVTPGGPPVPAPVPLPAPVQAVGPAPINPAVFVDADNQTRMLSKRKVQELVGQIDSAERLEPEVEDILLEVAEEFIQSATAFACRLAKHRKSDTLEVKDLQLHLERNWNMRIPGYGTDDIRSIRKPNIPANHQHKTQTVSVIKGQQAAAAAASKKRQS